MYLMLGRTMIEDTKAHPITATVCPQEAGMKLMRFLELHLADSPHSAELHRWIRTGQVRVNKKRAKPFALVHEGDVVRIPPFAHFLAPAGQHAENAQAGHVADAVGVSGKKVLPEAGKAFDADDLFLVAETGDYLVLSKGSGLAVQAGSGITDCVADRIKSSLSHLPYIPAPAHRLDRHTSGLVLAGKSHLAQQRLHALFSSRELVKEYLVWVAGTWSPMPPNQTGEYPASAIAVDGQGNNAFFPPNALPFGLGTPEGPAFFAEDFLVTKNRAGKEYIGTASAHTPGAHKAEAVYVPLHYANLRLPSWSGAASLLLVRLLTGRKHQIRVQVASRGCPVIGDVKYGGPRFFPMLLHAWRLTLPEGAVYSTPPRDWPVPQRHS